MGEENGLIDVFQVAERCGVSVHTVRNYYRGRLHSFPQPKKLGNRTLRWSAHAIDQWLKSRPSR